MSTLLEVEAKNIFKKAKSIVKQANKEICMTMDLAEEIDQPLPEEYFFLLENKLNQDVKIKRIGFGTEEDFKLIKTKLNLKNPNYQFSHADSDEYQRMLMIDQKYLLFALEEQQGRKYYYTDEKKYLKKYLEYFKNIPRNKQGTTSHK